MLFAMRFLMFSLVSRIAHCVLNLLCSPKHRCCLRCPSIRLFVASYVFCVNNSLLYFYILCYVKCDSIIHVSNYVLLNPALSRELGRYGLVRVINYAQFSSGKKKFMLLAKLQDGGSREKSSSSMDKWDFNTTCLTKLGF